MKLQQSLNATQQLVLTPQMRHAIRLLQLSNVELNQELSDLIESNPLLEFDDDPNEELASLDEPNDEAADDPGENDEEVFNYEDVAPQSTAEETELLINAIENDPALDLETIRTEPEIEWADSYASFTSDEPYRREPSYSFESSNLHGVTLREHLLHQAKLHDWTEREFIALVYLIEEIDEDGYLRVSIDDLAEELAPVLRTCVDELEAILRVLQSFEPSGVGARSLQECMLIQLDETRHVSQLHQCAYRIVDECFEELANDNHSEVLQRTGLTATKWDEVKSLIQSLNPRPGAPFANIENEYIVPDVIVRRSGDEWTVELDDAITPRIKVSEFYDAYSEDSVDKDTGDYLRAKAREARLLVTGFQYRNFLLLRVATEIVSRQRGFLERGEAAMLPMILADIADTIGVHESTVSRITSRKYMATPRGVFELKYFFSSSVSTTSGAEISSTAIRAMIREMTDQENKRKPLSDNSITQLLRDRDIDIARRTVAKYRESMQIPSSKLRRQSA